MPTAKATSAPAEQQQIRRLVAVFCLTQALGYGAMLLPFSVLLAPMSSDLETSRASLAGAAALSVLVNAVTSVPVGLAIDALGGRWVMTLGSGLGAGAVLWWAQADSILEVYAALALVGLALSMATYEAAFSVLVAHSSPHERHRAILAVSVIAGLGSYLCLPVLAWAEATAGWRTSLSILAVLLAACAVPLHVWAIPARVPRGRRTTTDGRQLSYVLKDRDFWCLAVSLSGQAAAFAAVLTLLVSYLVDAGYSLSTASSLLVAVGFLQVLSRLALGPVARSLTLAMSTMLAISIQGVGLVLLPAVVDSPSLTFLCIAAIGLGQGVTVIARPSMAADLYGPARFASILAALTAPVALSRAAAPIGAAWLGGDTFLYASGAVSFLAAAALLPLAWRQVAVGTPDKHLLRGGSLESDDASL